MSVVMFLGLAASCYNYEIIRQYIVTRIENDRLERRGWPFGFGCFFFVFLNLAPKTREIIRIFEILKNKTLALTIAEFDWILDEHDDLFGIKFHCYYFG